MNALAVFLALGVLVYEGLSLLFGVAIFTGLVLVSALVKRWGSDVEVTFFDDFGHEAIEQRHDECVDVRTIDVGIGHDDNLVVAQLVDIGLSVVLSVYTKAHADALNDVHHRLSLEHSVPLNLFHVQDFSTQWQYGLRVSVASLLSRSTCGVTLHQEYLTIFRVFV